MLDAWGKVVDAVNFFTTVGWTGADIADCFSGSDITAEDFMAVIDAVPGIDTQFMAAQSIFSKLRG
jgi:hypothetical protein